MDPTYKDPNPFIHINGGIPPSIKLTGLGSLYVGSMGRIVPLEPPHKPLPALTKFSIYPSLPIML